MSGLRGLTIVVAEASPGRFRTALTMAAAHSALGGQARLFLDAAAVALLEAPLPEDGSDAYRQVGLPSLPELLEETLSLGVTITACQSGLLLAGIEASDLDPRIDFAGMVGLLQQLGDDRLVVV